MHLTKDILGDATNFLIPQLKVNVEFYEGKAVSVELPPSVDMTVVETEPGLKGATVSNVTKPAKLETGLVVQVPPFINEGEKIRVSTSESAYLERSLSRADAESSSSSGNTVRRSSTRRSFSMRPMTGGCAGAQLRSVATASPGIASSHVGNDCSGVDPPPATLLPSMMSDGSGSSVANPLGALANFVGGGADHPQRGDFVPSLEHQMTKRGFERLRDQLVDPQRPEQRIAAQARHQFRIADDQPGLRSAQQFVAAEGNQIHARIQALRDARFGDAERA